MSCPNCDNKNYEIGQPCADCNFYEKPEYWDLGFCPIFIETNNWAVCFNGSVVEKEFASFRDAADLISIWDNEMNLLYTIPLTTIGGPTNGCRK